jgi:hypothetical protein
VSTPDVDVLRERWDATDLGQLAADPVMEPFMKDLKEQLTQKLSLTGKELGITWDDLKSVYAGETALAAIQPKGNKEQHAFILLCDVTGKQTEAQALLDKVGTQLQARGSTLRNETASGVALRVYTLPKKQDRSRTIQQAVLGIAGDYLIVADHLAEASALVGRVKTPAPGVLHEVPAFRAVMERVTKEVGDAQPHVRWFVEPFGLAEVARRVRSNEPHKGIDYLKILQNQGFNGVQGAGGYVQVKTGGFEFLHHTFVHVPNAQGGSELVGASSFKHAARMLDFPNATLETPEWLPRELATAITFNWRMKEAFEYSKTLVNEIADDPIFDDVLQSFRDDPLGPQIDIRKDVVAHLGTHITVASDYRLPITPQSERIMVAIELTEAEKVAESLNKAMARDPDVRKIIFGKHVIWEILDPTATEPTTTITLKIDGPGFGPLGRRDEEEDEEEEEKPVFPNSAITVAYGRLIWTSQVDFAKDLLAPRDPQDTLIASADFQAVNAALESLGASADSFRYFSRADESIRPTYELMRQGKMPEAETMLGRLLNELFSGEDDELLRKQKIDATQLPDYQVIRRHLGPGGVFVRTEQNGWMVIGCGLSKRAE